jgi:hypothetical protein
MQRIWLAAALLCLGAAPGEAREGPWCLRGDRGGGAMVDDCQYASYEACRDFIYLWGPTSSCIPNVNYRPNPTPPARKRKFR